MTLGVDDDQVDVLQPVALAQRRERHRFDLAFHEALSHVGICAAWLSTTSRDSEPTPSYQSGSCAPRPPTRRANGRTSRPHHAR